MCANLHSPKLVFSCPETDCGGFSSFWNEIEQLTSFVCWGFQLCRRAQRQCYVYPSRGRQDPAPRLHHYFQTVPTVPPLSLHPLPSLISNCLNLSEAVFLLFFFSTTEFPWNSGKAMEADRGLFPKTPKRLLCPETPQALLGYISSSSIFILQMETLNLG